jgi:hypothetical protein
MWAAEAVACGVPLICYEFPTIREIEEVTGAKNFYFAEYGNSEDLAKKLELAKKEEKFAEPSHFFDFNAMVERLRQIFVPEVKIGVITIALNEEQYINASLNAVIKHPNIKKVAVVEGAVNLMAHASTSDGLSIDGTDEQVYMAISEPHGNKIIFDRYGWAKDKSELRNRALRLLGNNITHVLVVDADEVWKQDELDKLVKAIQDNPQIGVFLFNFYHFWKKKDLIAVGGQWNSMLFRCFKFADKTLHWERHEAPVVNSKGRMINKIDDLLRLEDVHVYHYGYLKEAKNVQDKLEYYKKRDGDYLKVKDTWTDWKKGDETQPTHGGGEAIKFEGEHPEEVRSIL